MSKAELILSPYLASKPPVEKPTRSTRSAFITERPSCCPLRTRKGRYTSTLFIYTEFSSNVPPRTLYCDESSEWVDTPACVCNISSTALPETDGFRLVASTFISSVVPCCGACASTTTSSNWLSFAS